MVHNTAKNRADNFPSYPPDNHHCSDDDYLTEGGDLEEPVSFNKTVETRMWANAQPDGRPAEHRWRPLFNAVKFG